MWMVFAHPDGQLFFTAGKIAGALGFACELKISCLLTMTPHVSEDAAEIVLRAVGIASPSSVRAACRILEGTKDTYSVPAHPSRHVIIIRL